MAENLPYASSPTQPLKFKRYCEKIHLYIYLTYAENETLPISLQIRSGNIKDIDQPLCADLSRCP